MKPASALGLEIEEAAAREVVGLAAGYPYFLQEYGRELWNGVDRSPITSSDVAEVGTIVKETLARTFFGPRVEMASDAEQRYLAAMASLGDPPYASAAVARAWGAENQRQTSPHRDDLIQKGLIWSPRRGLVDFTVPLFAEYLTEYQAIVGYGEN